MPEWGFDTVVASLESDGVIKKAAAVQLRAAHLQDLEIVTLREQNKNLKSGKDISLIAMDLIRDLLKGLTGAFFALFVTTIQPLYLGLAIFFFSSCIYLSNKLGGVNYGRQK